MDETLEEVRANWGVAFYQDKLPDNIGRMRTLLETYSKIPPEEIDDHLYNIVRVTPVNPALLGAVLSLSLSSTSPKLLLTSVLLSSSAPKPGQYTSTPASGGGRGRTSA